MPLTCQAPKTGVTGLDGVALIPIIIRRFVFPGLYVLKFEHDQAPDLFSPAFQIIPPIKEIEIVSNPSAGTFFEPELVWYELQAATFSVTPGYRDRKISVSEAPNTMKGTVTGEHVDDQGPFLRVKDHRGPCALHVMKALSIFDFVSLGMQARCILFSNNRNYETTWGC